MPMIGKAAYVNIAFVGNTQVSHATIGKFFGKLTKYFDQKYLTVISTIVSPDDRDIDNLSTFCALNAIPHVERYLTENQTYKMRNKLLIEYPIDTLIVFPGYHLPREKEAADDLIAACQAKGIPVYYAETKDF